MSYLRPKRTMTVSRRCRAAARGHQLTHGLFVRELELRCLLAAGHHGPHETKLNGKPWLFPNDRP